MMQFARHVSMTDPERTRLAEALVGVWVTYDQLPYEIGTPECDRLTKASTLPSVYELDHQAALDFVDRVMG
jgi:hypothetical protein